MALLSMQSFSALKDLEKWRKSEREVQKYETFLEYGCSVYV